jgi:hypothetical protein
MIINITMISMNSLVEQVRYKLINDYPGCEHSIGSILIADSNGVVRLSDAESARLDAYPYLFKKLNWWEEREESEMPKFIKYWDISYYFPVDRVCKLQHAPFSSFEYTASNFYPATEEEFIEFTIKEEKKRNEYSK